MGISSQNAGAILEVDLGAIVANWRLLCDRHPTGAVAGVVKADAYGLGAEFIVPALHEAGCRHFFVAHLHEALAIRALTPGCLLAVLNGLMPGAEPDYVAADLTPVLGSLAEVAAWSAQAKLVGKKLPAMLHVDTGMSRLGLDSAGLTAVQDDPSRLDGIALAYVMTHLVSSEVPHDPMNQLQLTRFAAACAVLPSAPRSLANSSGIFLGAAWASDLARPGAALYGINPQPGMSNPMRSAVRLRARVLSIRDIPAGTSVGYNATWTATRPSKIATVAMGYADGWHRSQSGHGLAIFDGRPVPLVGRVSMDLTTFDATDHPAIVPGSWLEMIGPERSPDDVAAGTTNGYEILTSLGPRFFREYLS
jgi:alanine racemase